MILWIFTLFDKIPFWILIIPFFYSFVTGYGPVQDVDHLRRILGVSNNNMTVDIVLFFNGLLDNVLFRRMFLYLIPIRSAGNILDHIPAKDKLTWCCLQCCMNSASNSMVTMQLIEGNIQMDYLVVLLDFHDYFPSQKI
jgi:hypothetical protein